jgi:hypothetical protein
MTAPRGALVDFGQGAGDFAAAYGAGGVEGFEHLPLGGGGEAGAAAEVEGDAAVSEEQG